MEPNQFEEIKPLEYRSLNDSQKSRIKTLGSDVISKWKNDPDLEDRMNRFLRAKGSDLTLKKPFQEYVDQNLQDISWVLNGPGALIEHFDTKRKRLMSEQKGLVDGTLVIFYEGDQWSDFNLFNSNIKNWLHLMSKYLKDLPEFRKKIEDPKNTDSIIQEFFKPKGFKRQRSFAEDALFTSVVNELDDTKIRLKGTWTTGGDIEQKFLDYVIEKKGIDNVKSFMYPGSIVDQYTGVDLCINNGERWIPAQVKNNLRDAQSSIPRNGFSVFYDKTKDGWRYLKDEKNDSF
jgi:hypothetical protein